MISVFVADREVHERHDICRVDAMCYEETDERCVVGTESAVAGDSVCHYGRRGERRAVGAD